MIERNVASLQDELNSHQAAGDRIAVSRVARELRYWLQRLHSAEVQPPVPGVDVVKFGSKVTIERADGRVQAFRIVGEDEADPAHGSISYVSPMAQALIDRSRGDEVRAGTSLAIIVGIG